VLLVLEASVQFGFVPATDFCALNTVECQRQQEKKIKIEEDQHQLKIEDHA
jgi:hypothetical protein